MLTQRDIMVDKLHIGQIVRLTHFDDNVRLEGGGVLKLGFKAEKGKYFVLALLGVEDRKGDTPLDLEAVLAGLGFVKKDP